MRRILFLLFLILHAPGVCAENDNSGILATLRQDAPTLWREHRAKSTHTSAVTTSTIQYRGTRRVNKTTRSKEESFFAPNCGLVLLSSDNETAPVMAWGYNQQYCFSLSKRSGASTELWSVRRIVNDKEDAAWRQAREMCLSPNLLLTEIGKNLVLEEFIADSRVDMQVTSVNGNLVTIDFNVTKAASDEPRSWPLRASVTFDHAHYWVVTEYKRVHADGMMSAVTNEISYFDDFPIIKSRTGKDFASETSKDCLAEGVDEVKLAYPPVAVPIARFTLTSFGLPEPPGTTVLQRQFPWLVLSTIGGVVCLGIGLWLRRKFGK